VRLEELRKFKKIHLPACSMVPQPTTLPRAPASTFTAGKISRLQVAGLDAVEKRKFLTLLGLKL
jgi:hypothetical protein